MKVLVTGATGILGRVIVLELLKRGRAVVAAKRPSSNLEEVKRSYAHYAENHEELFSRIEWADVDFEDISALEEVLSGVSEVYHCAAKVSFDPSDEKEMFRSNINGTRNLLYACENSTVEKFLFVSSIAVLDGLNEEGMVDENSDFNNKLNHSGYAISKHFSEMEVWRASAEGLNTVIINPGVIIGTGNWESSSGSAFGAVEKFSHTFPGSASYVDVRDVANIAIELMERNIFGERFILVSENLRYSEFGQIIRKTIGLKEQKVLSNFKLDAAVVLSKLFGWLMPTVRMANRVNIDTVKGNTPISNRKIVEKIGYQFIPVSESIRFHLSNYIKDKK